MVFWVMVPRAGIEPALLSEPDFESGASTNSANGARIPFGVAKSVYTNLFGTVNRDFEDRLAGITKLCGSHPQQIIYSVANPA